MPRIIGYDLETLPTVAFVWDAKTDYIGYDQVIKESSIVCASWMELGSSKPRSISMLDYDFDSIYDDEQLSLDIAKELGSADLLIGQNSSRFDRKVLNERLVYWDHPCMPPVLELDILTKSRQSFKRWSHRLDARGKSSGLGGKDKVSWELWRNIAMMDFGGSRKKGEDAIRKMVRYNKRDVELMLQVYEREKPFYHNHPSLPLLSGIQEMACSTCSSRRLTRQGIRPSKTGSYQRYQCQDCGSWNSGTVRINTTTLRSI